MTPICEVCGKECIFYMHQRYGKEEGKMAYYHVECCPECNVVTDSEFLDARTRACAEVGLTWDELLAKRRPCGCCFDGPDIYRRIWFAYNQGEMT